MVGKRLAVLEPLALSNAPHFSGVFVRSPSWRRPHGDAMIERICLSKRVVNDLRGGALEPFLEKCAAILSGRDRTRARRTLLCAGRFAAFATARGRAAGRWDDELLVEFLLAGPVAVADAHHGADARALLREAGCLVGEPESGQFLLRLLADLDVHLRDERGLLAGERVVRADVARQLLAHHRRCRGQVPLAVATGEDVLGLFQAASRRYASVATRQKFAGQLRQVLRFLQLRGHIAHDLATTVPLFVNYRLSTVPAHLPWSDVQHLVAAVDAAVAPGRRDRAILLLIARLGLRPGTVRALAIEDIDWRRAVISLHRTKSRRGTSVPLTEDVGQALSDYLLHERPSVDCRTVFLKHTAPHVPFASSSAITEMIYGRLDRAGIARAKGAATLLRHSLATQLVNSGVPVKQVADVFAHRSIDTTAIYTKVDTAALSQVPLAFGLGVAP